MIERHEQEEDDCIEMKNLDWPMSKEYAHYTLSLLPFPS